MCIERKVGWQIAGRIVEVNLAEAGHVIHFILTEYRSFAWCSGIWA